MELGGVYYHLGLEDLGDREYERALEIDPTSEHVKNMFTAHISLVNKYDEWLTVAQKLYPNKNYTTSWYLMGKGQLDEAQKKLDAVLVKYPDNQELSGKKPCLLL